MINRSPFVTQVDVVRDQPVKFSHEHHVRGLGIDCRYCHTSVEESNFAGVPPTYTCMSCHSQVWTEAPLLEPVRQSLADGQAAALDAGSRPAGLRLLQPQHPREQGGWLCVLPRAHRPDAADVEGRADDDGLVPRMPPEPGAEPAAGVRDLRPRLVAPRPTRSSRTTTGARSLWATKLKQHYGIPEAEFLTSCSVCHR